MGIATLSEETPQETTAGQGSGHSVPCCRTEYQEETDTDNRDTAVTFERKHSGSKAGTRFWGMEETSKSGGGRVAGFQTPG